MTLLVIIILTIFLIILNRRCKFCGKISFKLYKVGIREDEDDLVHYEKWCEKCLSHLPYEYD